MVGDDGTLRGPKNPTKFGINRNDRLTKLTVTGRSFATDRNLHRGSLSGMKEGLGLQPTDKIESEIQVRTDSGRRKYKKDAKKKQKFEIKQDEEGHGDTQYKTDMPQKVVQS